MAQAGGAGAHRARLASAAPVSSERRALVLPVGDRRDAQERLSPVGADRVLTGAR